MLSATFAALMLAAAPPVDSLARELTLDAEAGPAYVFQNDNRYGPNGTRYTADDVGQQRNLFIGRRLSAEVGLGERHTLIFLYAPLDLTTRVSLPKDIDFRGTLFRAGDVVDHRYLFDGYRLSYLYRLTRSERWTWDIGASVQIRNASVELRSVDEVPSRFALQSDIGTVFAVKTRLRFQPNPRLWATVDADVISSFGVFRSFSGGLYDLALTLGTPLTRGVDGFLRARWLGGGAEVTSRDIDNWANLFFLTAGLRVDLVRLPLPTAD